MKKEVIKYTTNKAEIAKMSAIYMELTIKGLEDIDGFEAVHAARMVMVKHRTNTEKLRKTTNADAQMFIKTNNANAKRLLDLMQPIEIHLKTEEEKVTKEKERIKAEEERLEKIKIDDRVTALFAVSVNIPYFDAAMLTNKEYEIMFDEATNKHNIERLRLQEEQKAKEEAEAKLAAERAEIERIRKEQEAKAKAQADKEKALEDERKAIEDAKKAEADRKKREAFEKKTKEDARIQAKKNREREKEEHINRIKEVRYKALKSIGYLYSLDDLGKMPDKKYFKLLDKHQAIWNTKQSKLLAEQVEKKRLEKEKAEVAEKARIEALKPDKEKLIQYAKSLTVIVGPDIKNKTAQHIIVVAEERIANIAHDIIQQAKEL